MLILPKNHYLRKLFRAYLPLFLPVSNRFKTPFSWTINWTYKYVNTHLSQNHNQINSYLYEMGIFRLLMSFSWRYQSKPDDNYDGIAEVSSYFPKKIYVMVRYMCPSTFFNASSSSGFISLQSSSLFSILLKVPRLSGLRFLISSRKVFPEFLFSYKISSYMRYWYDG